MSMMRGVAAFLVIAVAISGASTLSSVASAQSAMNGAAVVASPDRSAEDRAADERRKPAQVLDFIGVRPGMIALDVSTSTGYFAELLARAIGNAGTVYGQTGPAFKGEMPPVVPGGPLVPRMSSRSPDASVTAFAKRNAAMKAAGVSAAALVPVVGTFEQPAPADRTPGGLDLVTLMNNYHDLGYLGTDRAAMNSAIFEALKPGGHYVLTDYAGRPGTGISEANTTHRIDEAFLRKEIEAAGFKLEASADFLRNPKDPRTRNLPADGQTKDVFVLKFVKP